MGQAIVGFAPGAMPALRPGDSFGGHPVLRTDEGLAFAVLRADDLVPLRAALQGDARVAYVEDDKVLTASAIPDDPRWSAQYGPPMMGFPSAWDQTLGGAHVTVAVIDTGIRRNHEDFDPALLLQGWDFVGNDNDPDDDCGHGTHVAGTVGAWTNNGVGVAGMAQVKILPMRVLSQGLLDCTGSTSDVASAVREATDQGAHIITMSLGGGGSSTLSSAVHRAWNAGVLVIAAAGNDGGCCVNYPAAYESVIAVSAVSSSKSLASYSSTGPQVELTAPGSNIVSTYNDGGYASASGTSMAAPHVAGAAALALSWNPGLGNVALRDLLAETAEDLGPAGRDSEYGHGLVRIDALFGELRPPLPGPENLPPMADFTWSAEGLRVAFDATPSSDADGDALTYTWDLGDGTVRAGAQVTHDYAANGTYRVHLEAEDGNGGKSGLAWDVTVAGGSWGDPAPGTPELEPNVWSTTSIVAGETRLFKVLIDRPVAGMVVETSGPTCRIPGVLCELDIEFAVRYEAPPTADAAACRKDPQGASTSCILGGPDEGWWFVRLDATEGSGDVEVRVRPYGDGGARAPENEPPVLRWGYRLDGFNLTVVSNGTGDRDMDPLSFTWVTDFGNFSGPSFTHTLSDHGTYAVEGLVADGAGGRSHLAGEVQALSPDDNSAPLVSFAATLEERLVHFDASDTLDPDGDGLSYMWDFGDGNSGSGVAVSHEFAADGDYDVRLNVTDAPGAWAVQTMTVHAARTPDPAPDVAALQNGVERNVDVAAGEVHAFKVYLEPGNDWVHFRMDGASCGLTGGIFGCPHDVDMVVKHGAPVAGGSGDCVRENDGADATCVQSEPLGGWWFLELRGESGTGTVSLQVDWPGT